MHLDADGDLIITVAGAEVRQQLPKVDYVFAFHHFHWDAPGASHVLMLGHGVIQCP